ncbi:glycosyltransferase family 2 protein [Microvirga sp. P5_D2]
MLPAVAHGEFRSVRRDVPRPLVNLLACITLVYGVILTVALPWSLLETSGTWAGSATTGWFEEIGRVLLAVIGSLMMLRWCITQGIAFVSHDRIRRKVPESLSSPPFVSILVPAWNESDTIISAINSLIALEYPRYEVIVVDDGSSDDTFAKASPLAGDYGRCLVRVFRKDNGGKWSALNYAFKQSSGALILCVDADSRLSHDALAIMVPRLQEPGVVGVSGQVAIRNRANLLTRLQALEYLLSNGGMRMALSHLGVVTVVPGPIGLYKRSILEQIERLPGNRLGQPVSGGKVYGPLSDETFAEDFQLSLSALALGGRIVYEPRACAYTKCPDRVETLISQRYRWIRGTWQVFTLYMRDLRPLARRKGGLLDPVMMLIYPVDIYCLPIVSFVVVGSVVGGIASGLSLGMVAEWGVAVGLLNILTATVHVLEQDEELSLLPLVLLIDLYQSLLVNFAWVIAAIDEVRGARMKW